ncbi:MAG: hypothetical protein M3Y58_08765 [Chloroflexota bacterium]|nr:hypothetical protein [Chloroflexota bacterium]
MVDQFGNVAARYGYDPYGQTVVKTGPVADGNPFRYTGAYLDATGLYKMGARYYDPARGRFTQLDPLGHRYVYAGNNPANFVDPTGLDGCDPGNTCQGTSNNVYGTGNTVVGDNNTVYGNDNSVYGDDNKVRGDDNRVAGNDNQVDASGEFVYAKGGGYKPITPPNPPPIAVPPGVPGDLFPPGRPGTTWADFWKWINTLGSPTITIICGFTKWC